MAVGGTDAPIAGVTGCPQKSIRAHFLFAWSIQMMGCDRHQLLVHKWAVALLAAFVLVCVLFLLIQNLAVRDLRDSIQALSSGVNAAGDVPASAAAPQSENHVSVDDGSSKERVEIERLTKLSSQLTSEVAQLEQMRLENKKLLAELDRPQIAGLTSEEIDAVAKARNKALSVACVNNLKQFGLAARLWALDNEDRLPPNIVCMSNELSTPKILVCPADNSRQVATDWSTFTPGNCSYEQLATSGSEEEPSRVLSRCRIHGHVGLCDGSVQMEVAKNHPDYFVFRDGKLFMEPPPVPNAAPTQPSDTDLSTTGQ